RNSNVQRFLLAHALLATNQNNRSLCLFKDVREPIALSEWSNWTANFKRAYNDRAVAHFLTGDAHARSGDFLAAEAEFGNALAIKPDHALGLNARAQLFALSGQGDKAILDANRAARVAPGFADAHATLGTIGVRERFSSDWILKSYKRALQLAPDFALAING